MIQGKKCPPSFLPTPQEIQKACEEIQANWSDEERERRNMRSSERVPWKVRQVPSEFFTDESEGSLR